MRVLMIGAFDGHMAQASKIAMQSGATVSNVETIEGAMASLRGGRGADLLLCDIAIDIAGLILALQGERIHIPVIACGIGANHAAAARAIRAGASDYLSLPPDPDLIAAILTSVAADSQALLFWDPRMGEVVSIADRVAPSVATVLITGESGTGKEILARYIHRKSRRSRLPLISVNCAAIPETLIESELFGHEKGAFTGAIARRIGKFEEAHGGTLLLDEISETPVHVQAKLLRAIQEREIDRLGGTTTIPIDIRLVVTSNRDLEQLIRDGAFREDLYFRLNVIGIEIPPLRQRPDDILALTEHFAKKYAQTNDVPVRELTEAAKDKLREHSWRGNVRELENTLHRAVLLAQGDVIDETAIVLSGQRLACAQTMPRSDDAEMVSRGVAGRLVGRKVADVERDLILGTVGHCLGNRTEAANILGISIRALRNKLRAYAESGGSVMGGAGGISGPEGESAP